MKGKSLGFSGLCLVAVAALGFKCAPKASLDHQRVSAPGSASASVRAEAPPMQIELAYVALNRRRRFAEARSLLAQLPAEQARLPSYRFANAYLAVRTNDGSAALPLLEGLEQKLVELAPDVEQLRALAQLQTDQALLGAAWLSARGRSDAWLDAARGLLQRGAGDTALMAIEKGLQSAEAGNSSRATRRIAEYRWLRIKLHDAKSQAERAIDDLRWLALEEPGYVAARERVAHAIDESQLRLEASQQVQRLRRLADVGWVERLELELSHWQQHNSSISPALAAYLRGRVRLVARSDQIEGAKLLTRAADLQIDDAVRVRMDAARLYVREGDVERATLLYDRVAKQKREKSQEARYYAARAAATLGQARRGIERYSQFIQRFAEGTLRRAAESERALSYLALGDNPRAYSELTRMLTGRVARDEDLSLLELAGLAALRSGKAETATERWQNVLTAAPLSLAGAFAAERLRQMSVELPTLPLKDGPSGPSEPTTLSRRVDQLLAFGLDEMAAEAQRSEEERTTERGRSSSIESSCRNWGKIGYGARGFAISRRIRGVLDTSKGVTEGSRWQWDCRFPRPYAALVAEFEREYHLPQELLFAVMRQESAFDPDIVSPAGAVGLMQLLPETARRIAEEIQAPYEIRLEEPQTNLRLGAAYLRKLLDVFDQNLVLAVASYNAGPRAVALWLRHAGVSSVELFAARIPYAETQKYVDRVIGNLIVYRYLNKHERYLDGLSLDLPKELKDSSSLY